LTRVVFRFMASRTTHPRLAVTLASTGYPGMVYRKKEDAVPALA